MLEMIWHALEHTFFDTIKLIPFLFLTYAAMEYLEHHTGDKANTWVKKSGKFGPAIGSVLGMVPQCGFSAAASNLYAGRVITLGTLIAIYLSTSDEMLPIMISGGASGALILKVLASKVVIGMVMGFLVDLLFRRKEEHEHIHDICEQENCHCEKGILHSAVKHTLQITVFIFLIGFLLELVLEFVGEENLAAFITNETFMGPIISGIVGLIPNCASSVAITELYLDLNGAMNFGTMMSGLLVNAGVGVLVLFRVNHSKKENFTAVGLLFLIGIVCGILMNLLNF